MPIAQVSTDTINLTNPVAGDANAGNGGDGTNNGDIFYNPVANVSNAQTVIGSAPTVFNGDIVGQTAGWTAGNADGGDVVQIPIAVLAALTNTGTGGAGGSADSNGDQSNESGGNVAAVSADTTATQNTTLVADQSATILAGVGGAGGSGNAAVGGDISAALVHSSPIAETTTNTTTVSNILDDINNTFGTIEDIGI
ncbi:PE-PGRS family protein [Ensifer sp. NBAIM29]|nr:PE-PGRS family protein [Ensifer sp. NBAIM29]